MKTQLCVSGVFGRQVSLEPIVAIPGQFCLEFQSSLETAKDPQAVQRNFQAILGRDDVLALRDLLSAMLQAQMN